MKMKSTKKALLMSALSLLLCCSMLIGTTFAWFTDSVESGVNRITAGNLDVEVYYGKEAKPETNKVTGATKIFTDANGADILWEPGAVAYTNLNVVNEGSLELKYQFAMNFQNENFITENNAKLSEVLKVAFLDGAIADGLSREQILAAAKGQGVNLKNLMKTGTLAADKNMVYGVVIYWEPSDLDNRWNVFNGRETNDGQALHIELGLKLVATQKDAEQDSFGNDYDAGAPWLGGVDYSWYDADAAELTISNAEQLAGLAAIVNGTAKAPVTTLAAGGATTIQDDFAGQTIKLSSNLNLNNLNWTPIGSFDYDRANDGSYANVYPFRGIFDGQGHTIYNLSIDTPNTDGAGLFACAEAATIKNVNVHNVDIVAASHAAAILGRGYKYATTTTVTNCHVTGNVSILIDWAYAGGIVAKATGLNISDCSVLPTGTGVITAANRNAVGGIVGWVETESGSTFTNCKAANLNLTGWTNIGAITGYIQYGCKIDGCSAENIVLTKTREDGIAAVGLASGCWSYNASKPITITNNTFKNITLNGTYVANTGANILYGGEYSGTTNTNFVLENNVQENIVNNMVEVSEIRTVDDLKTALSTSGKYVLKNDLNVTETVTVPAGVDVVLYMNGKTIAGTNTATATHNDLFLVKGELTVNGGTITLNHAAANMGWNGATSVFDVTAGGVLNLNGTTVRNLGNTDMNFAVHMNNWGEVTLNVEDSFLEATYIPVRVFNSGPDMNNVTIKNSTLKSEKNHSFWVHNYASADFGGKLYSGSTAAYDESQVKARLNFDIFGNGNTFITGKAAPVRYGFNKSYYFNENGALIVNDAEALTDANGGNIALAGTVDLGGTQGNYLTLTEDTTITGGTIKGTGWTGELNYAVNASSGNIVFDGVTFDTTNWSTVGWANWGISVNVNGTANVTFKNCTFKGTQCPIYQSGADAVVTLENCTFTGGCIQCEIYSGDFQLGQDLIVKNCDFTGMADVLHIYDYDKDPTSDAIAQYLTDNGNIFTGTCKQTCQ